MKKILIVDDNEQNLYLLQTILEGYGYSIERSKNGIEALEKARKNPPAIVVSDILMPTMDGFTLCREWEKDENLQNIPFIFYTATYTDPKDEELALNLGAVRFITKPVEAEAFVCMLQEVLQEFENGRLELHRPPVEEEMDYYRLYNEVLIHKLEKKMLDLSELNKALELDIIQRREAENEIRKLNIELETRVTERTAQLKAINDELESFAHSVSHDLRAPLRAIQGFSQILLEDSFEKLNTEEKQLLERVIINTKTMDQLINDLLSFSRVAPSEMHLTGINMTSMANSVYLEIASPKVQKKIEFSVTSLPKAFGDITLIKQVWSNLISNAIKYTLPKDVRKIEIGSFTEKGMNVYYIKDTGVGYDPSYQHKLFGIFQRLHRADEFEGTGVGLAIVKRIITRHDGNVWAEGKVNEGATFYFSLPVGNKP
jgi:signal transduction histidine kinase